MAEDVVTSPTLWDRISNWTSENKAVVYTVAGVLVVTVAGGSVYYYNRRKPRARGGSIAGEKTSIATSTSDSEEPASPSASGSPGVAGSKKKKKKSKKPSPPSASLSDETPSNTANSPDLSKATSAEKKAHADSLKKIGNSAYAKKDHATAIAYYTKAIDVYPSDPVYFSNRAACHAAKQDHESVIRDTTRALELDPSYVKALNRRANAYENVGRLQDALLDLTASSILDNFETVSATNGIERLLKKIAEAKAQEMLKDRSSRMPSHSFVSAYLDAFRPRTPPVITSTDESKGDVHLKRALDAIARRQYKQAVEHLAVTEGKAFSSSELEALALNTSATFKFVRADVESALREIDRSIELSPQMTNSYVKRASMHMELNDRDATLRDFGTAIEINAEDPDIYYHRGQCNFIVQEFSAAAKDYQKSIELDPSFVFSHIQLGVAQYKLGSISASMSTFRRCISRFPNSAEVFNYYGELLLDQGKFEEAIDKFDQAIALERGGTQTNTSDSLSASMSTASLADNLRQQNVMPLINKALAVFQWKKDIAQAEELCRRALMLDDESDVALATLSQFLLTQGKARDALQYFEKSAQVARTEPEIVNALSYAEATRTQLELERKYPDLAQRMATIAQAARAQQSAS